MDQRAYGGPLRYFQGAGVMADPGRQVAPLGDKALLLTDGFVADAQGEGLRACLAAAGVAAVPLRCSGESTDAEVGRCAGIGREAGAHGIHDALTVLEPSLRFPRGERPA